METNLNGIRLHFEDDGAGPAVLLLHAFPLSGAMWGRQVAALSAQYRVVVPDLRGFGGSDAPPGPLTMDQQADDIAALLDHLGIERAAIVGLSMGGYITFALARRHADRVAALVLADTKAGADNEEGKAGRETNARLAEEQGAAAIADKMIPSLVAERASNALRDELRELITANSQDGIAGALRGMAMRPDSTPDLAGITAPALVIVGAQDKLTPPEEAAKLQAGLSGAGPLIVIPEAGHLTNMEAPEAFNEALLDFLGRLGSW
jgi:3-oxoadipate enol-lactonase